jgi:hypothetical protein
VGVIAVNVPFNLPPKEESDPNQVGLIKFDKETFSDCFAKELGVIYAKSRDNNVHIFVENSQFDKNGLV